MSRRSGIMLCYPFEEKRLLKWNPPYLVQPKLDGERCRAQYAQDTNEWLLLSSEQNVFSSIPHIQETLKDQNIPLNVELDGELYVHGLDFSEIHSIVGRTVNLHAQHEKMEYHIFDIVSKDPQWQRQKTLWHIEEHMKPPLRKVPNYIADSFDDVMEAYDDILAEGYEGIIVRHIDNVYVRRRSTFLMKFKPKKSDFYKIVGYKEEVSIHGEAKNRLGALVCVGDDDTTFSVGSGLNDDLRETLWIDREALIGRLCHVSYQHITSGKGVPRFPVFVEILDDEPVEEIKNPFLEIPTF